MSFLDRVFKERALFVVTVPIGSVEYGLLQQLGSGTVEYLWQ